MKKFKGYYPMYDVNLYGNNTNGFPFNQVYGFDTQPMYRPSPSGIQLPRQDEDEYDETEIQYMKSMYPSFCKKVQVYIDEECDRLEYDGSCMYDEYPDRDTIEKITDRIQEQVRKDEDLNASPEDMEGMQLNPYPYDYQNDLIKLLFLNELFNRRRNRYFGGRYRRMRPYNPSYYYDYRRYFD